MKAYKLVTSKISGYTFQFQEMISSVERNDLKMKEISNVRKGRISSLGLVKGLYIEGYVHYKLRSQGLCAYASPKETMRICIHQQQIRWCEDTENTNKYASTQNMYIHENDYLFLVMQIEAA